MKKTKLKIIAILLCLCLLILALAACQSKPDADPTPTPQTEENNPPTPDPDPTADPNTPPTDPTAPTEYTEAEYKAMCDEKISNLLVHDFEKGGVSLSNVDILTINISNGNIYYTALLNAKNARFCTANLDFGNVESYQELHNEIKDRNTITLAGPPAEMISDKVSETVYNNFLNSVITDEGFRTALANEGITFSEDINQWEDLATVVNAKKHDSNNIIVDFIDLNNNKTVSVRVYAYLTCQESGSINSQVVNTTIRDKSYKNIDVQDFATFDEI